MPQCDSSQTGMRAVRPEPSPADLQPDWTAGVSEVSRFSCMKFLGVPWGLRPRRTEQKLVVWKRGIGAAIEAPANERAGLG